MTNPTDAPLDHVRLFLYPRIYATDPQLDDLLMPRVYPGAFDAGDQTLDCPHELATGGAPIAIVPLEASLAPGETTTVECGFTTTVPRKYGTFGRTRRTLTMNGGLHPMPVTLDPVHGWLAQAPPPPLPHEVDLDIPDDWGGIVAGRVVGDSEDRPLIGPATPREGPARWVSVGLHRHMEHWNFQMSDGHSVTWVGRPLKKYQRRWVRRAAEQARETLTDRGLTPDRGIVLVEAPLRRNLVEVGDGVVYVSDRFLEVAAPFWRYHDLHFARALLADGMLDLVDAREAPLHVPTTLDGASWELLPSYLRARWRNHVGLKQMLERVRFLPAVDTLLETPVFPFADQIFDNPWVVDPVKADVRRFNRPLRSGRVLFLKLQDLVGEATLSGAVRAWMAEGLEGTGDLHAVLLERSGRDGRALAHAWLRPPSRENLRIESVRRSRDEDGFHVTEVTVRRDVLAGEPTDEVIEIRVDPAGPRKKRGRVTLRWEGQEAVSSWEVRTAGRTGAVTVDPRRRILEVDAEGIGLKRDNRSPRGVRVTGYAYFLALEASAGLGLEAYAALNLRPLYDTRHHVMLRLFTDPELRLGSGLSYVHYFGPRRVGTYRRHRIVASMDFDWLNTAFLATDAPFVAELRGSYIWETRTGGFFPTRGGRLAVSLFAGKDIALKEDHLRSIQESGYAGVDVTAIQLLRLHPWHVIALRGKLGVVTGNVVHRQFNLGGANDLRGIPANHVVGNFRASATVEWRHFFVRDADVQMILSRFRGLQGSLFVESGVIATDPSEPPGLGDVGFSVGYGLRVYGDWLGTLPAIGGIEIAWSPGAPDGRIPLLAPYERWPRIPFQVYLVGTQSF